MIRRAWLEHCDGSLTSRRVDLDIPDRVTAGRHEDCSLLLPGDDASASRFHFLLEVDAEGAVVSDLGSANGTWINGERLDPESRPTQVLDGDIVRAGATEFRLRLSVASGASTERPSPTSAATRRYHTQKGRSDPLDKTAPTPECHIALETAGYELGPEVGRGGMGTALLAHSPDGERVVVKVLDTHLWTDDFARGRFLREVDVLCQLDHPHIVRAHAPVSWDGGCCVVMDYCSGGTVSQLLQRHGGSLDVEQALPLMRQALEGMSYAHGAALSVDLADGQRRTVQGVVHRDIKPSNLLLQGGDPPQIKVSDFGLAKAFETSGLSGRTETGISLGTPYFMSRDQLTNFKYPKPSVDVWSLGATFYNMLTGHYPRDFTPGLHPAVVAFTHPVVPIARRTKRVPAPLAAVIDRALSDSVQERYADAGDLLDAVLDATDSQRS